MLLRNTRENGKDFIVFTCFYFFGASHDICEFFSFFLVYDSKLCYNIRKKVIVENIFFDVIFSVH